MSLFKNQKIGFSKIDPLGGGLAEEIAAEKQSQYRITLEESPNGNELAERWQEIVNEAHGDTEYFFDQS